MTGAWIIRAGYDDRESLELDLRKKAIAVELIAYGHGLRAWEVFDLQWHYAAQVNSGAADRYGSFVECELRREAERCCPRRTN
jgi:hypothetical protein